MAQNEMTQRLAVRLPDKMKRFIGTEAGRNLRSMSNEIVAIVRDRMEASEVAETKED